MSQDLLEKILVENSKFYNDELIKYLLCFKKDDYIYPSTIKRKFKYEDKDIYELLDLLEEKNILKKYYEIFCYNCSRLLKLYELFNDIDSELQCENCDEKIDCMDNCKVVYKVVA